MSNFSQLVRWLFLRLRFLLKRNVANALSVLLMLLLIFCFLERTLLTKDIQVVYNSDINRTEHVLFYPTRDFKHKTRKLLLAWTPMWFKWSTWQPVAEEITRCPNTSCLCEFTTDKTRLYEADAVLFHCFDLMPWTVFPRYRDPSQVWIVWCVEPPTKIWNSLHGYKLIFNWTMHYKRDSTVFAPYYHIRKFKKHEILKEVPGSIIDNKSRGIILRNSNCFDDIQRYKLYDELRRYLNIDFYGSCGDLICYSDDPVCIKKIKSYMLSVQFENSYCKDYVTEKYSDALIMNQIPIVNWKTNQISDHVLPHSYININDFPSIKDAAAYINKVLHNETLFKTYFEWKRFYEIHSSGVWRQFCFLCDALHDENRPAQIIVDLNAWFADDTCPKGSVYSIIRRVFRRLMYNIGL